MVQDMLKDKIALVTGATKGIGRQIALTLAGEGAYVYVNYRGSIEKAQDTVEAIKANDGNCEAICFDVASESETKEAIESIVKKEGRLDILVNNAGITRDNLIMRMSEEDFEAVLDTNLLGVFHTVKFASRYMMKARSGRIINISSVSGILGNAGQANYAAAKAGIIGLTKSMARELSSRNITVNAIAPGFIETDMTNVLSEEVKNAAISKIPLGHFGNVDDIANMAAYLASDKAGYITGQVICVDGGMAM